MLNGDFPSKRNLWMLHWEPDSVLGSYSSPSILRTFFIKFANKWSRSPARRSKTSISPLLKDADCFRSCVFTFLVLQERINLFLLLSLPNSLLSNRRCPEILLIWVIKFTLRVFLLFTNFQPLQFSGKNIRRFFNYLLHCFCNRSVGIT